MQEIIRRCDRDIRGKACGERVPEDSPTTFVVNSVTYQMDLCAKHYTEFINALEPFLHIAEPTMTNTGKAVRKALKGRNGAQPFTTKDVRKWLMEKGREVSPTGRIPNSLIEEYREAHV